MPVPKENGTTFSAQTGPTKRNQTLAIFYPFSKFPTVKSFKAVNWFVKNEKADFGLTEMSEPPPASSRGDLKYFLI